MFKIMFISLSVAISVISPVSAGELAAQVQAAVPKTFGKCRVGSIENETISIFCVNSNFYSSFKITVENDVISGTGAGWSNHGEESECVITGKVKESEKIKLSIRCLSTN